MGLHKRNDIDFVWKNDRGALCICGDVGFRQYYGYTKNEAIAMYRSECKETVFYGRKTIKRHPVLYA